MPLLTVYVPTVERATSAPPIAEVAMMAGVMTAMVTVLVVLAVICRRTRKALMAENVPDMDSLSDAGSPIPVFGEMVTPASPPTKLDGDTSPIEYSSSTIVSSMTIATSPDSIDYDSDIIVDF
jgi:hypothetical protein